TVRNKAGAVFTVFVTSTAIVNDDGAVIGRLGVSTDVSQRRGDEARSRQLAAIIEGADDAIIETDLRGVIRHANPAVRAVYGYTPAELIGRDVELLAPTDDGARAAHRAMAASAAADGSPGVLVVGFRHRDGSLVDISVRQSPVRDEAGSIVGIATIGRDISAEVRTRASLELSERRFRARFDQASVPQAMTSLDGRTVSANAALCHLLGVDQADLEGIRLVDEPDPRAGVAQDSHLARVLAGEREADTWERTIPGGAGRAIPVLVHATLLREPDGTAYGVALFLQDLTGLRSAERALSRQQALAEALARRASDWAVVLNAAGSLVYVSAAAAAALGYDPVALEPRRYWNLIHCGDLPDVERVFRAVVDTPGGTGTVQFRVARPDGRWRWVAEVFTNCLADPDIAGVVCNGRDVTAQVEAAGALGESEARYRAIAETAQEGIWAADLTGRTWYANHRVADVLGVALSTVYEGGAAQLLDPDGVAGVAELLRRCHEHGPTSFEASYRRPDGSGRVLRASVAPLRDDIGRTGSLAMISDVTEARHGERELRRRALCDDLTGLANRTMLTDRFEQALARRHQRGDGAVAIVFADLDQFKLVNESWGHEVGDLLLIQVAARLRAAVRAEDTVARFGGDEFVVVCESASLTDGAGLAQRLQDALSTPFDVENQRVYVTASVGVAVSPPHSAPDLVRFAECAMYEAKSRGRGRVRVFDGALADEVTDRLALSNDLRDALLRDDLTLCYQPVVNLLDGRILSVEALARWRHPTRGPVSPAEFVAVAEATGLGPALDRWVLNRACRDAERLGRVMAAPPRVAVNISARHLADPELEGTVLTAMRDTALADGGLILEITETAVMDSPGQAVSFLHGMRAHGVEAAIDDFGTGYSSLSYLKRLPVTTLKIDRSFVNDITSDPDALAITSAIFNVATTMRLKVVAEGIETVDQLRLLRSLGCTAGQGFLFSPGLPVDALLDAVARLPRNSFDVSVPDAAIGPGDESTPIDRLAALS
ncbi:MAG TPA: EAL domain-containing protein, partial [Catenuloplanes sp.]